MQNTTNNSTSDTSHPSKHSRRNVLMDWYRNHGHTNSGTMKQSRGSEATLTHRSNISESTFVANGSRESKNGIPNGSQDTSQGLHYVSKVGGELASIDKVNDPNSNTLVCAGKSQLYTYRFDPDGRTIKLSNSISQTNSLNSKVQSSALSSSSSFLPKRSRQTKFSTIADVKCGFQGYTHYAAICTNSTSISIFNINDSSSSPSGGPSENPIVCNFDEHKRSVNSFDFNMVQPQLLISGGQDGCAKVWDLRSSHTDGRCEVSINTAYDSIRDIKWMPGYNFAGSTVGQGGGRAHGGYKFASVHDSGVLLKFDLRQPQQIEGKINAHTGPCLCLNWHPNDDYIATGGRDGKCCLWYIGDKQQQQQQQQSQPQGFESYSPGNYHQNHTFGEPSGSSGNTQLTSFPETTINIGFPITKLKYAPAFSNDPTNSLLGISAMGDKAQVMVYSFARRYIPKYYLGTSTSSVGFVWWDENTLFNIDKSNHMYGWDITEEPTVLDNLPKIVSTWRDIDGNGFLFVDQKIGTYDSTNPYNNKASMVDYTIGQGTSNSNGSVYANGNILNTSGNGGGGGGSSNNSNVNASSFPTSQHTKRSSTHFNLPTERPSFSRALTTFNSKALLSSSTSSSKSHSSSPSVNSLPLHFGAPTDGLATEVSQEVSSAASSTTLTNMTIGNGNNSSYNCSGGVSSTQFYSPTVMTLDLPHIFNHMRLSQISPSNPVETVKLQESPVELFKHLAKELEFSIEREKEETADGMATLGGNPDIVRSKDESNEQTYKDLMKRIGLSENGTWANLINKTATNTSASAHEKTGGEKLLLNLSPNKVGTTDTEELLLSSENSDYSGPFDDVDDLFKNKNKYKREVRREGSVNPYGRSDGNSNSGDDETDYGNDEQSLSNAYGQDVRGKSGLSEALGTHTLNIQKRIETLLNLVSVANHNAGVYMKVNDKLNCKIWILIRDSILWDLKNMDAFVNANYDGENLDDILGYDSKFLASSCRDKSERRKSFQSTSTDFSVPEEIDRLLAVNQSREDRKPSNAFSEVVEEEEEDTNANDNANENDARERGGQEPRTENKSGTVEEKTGVPEDKDTTGSINGDNNANNTNNDHNDENTNGNSDPVVNKKLNSEVLDRRNSDPGDLLANQRHPKRASFIDTILSADYPQDSTRDDGLGIFGSPGRASTRYLRKFSMSPPSLKSFHSLTPTSFEDLLSLSNSQFKGPGKETAGSSGPNRSEEPVEDLTGAPWDAGSMLRQIFKQAAETGNILLAISILLLFQDVYHITSIEVVKNSLSEFINLLHRYELFELAAALLKYCKYDDIIGLGEGQSSIQLYCPSCGELVVNERSKERYTLELQQLQRQRKATTASRGSDKFKSNNGANADTECDRADTPTSPRLTRFGYWYCDLCRRPNTLCVLCERPITKLSMGILKCGHQGHFECFKEWFLKEGMDTCPAGCQDTLNL